MFWLYQPMLLDLGIAIAFFGIIQATWIGVNILIMNNYERLEKFFGSKRRYLLFSALLTAIMLICGSIAFIYAFLPVVLVSIILVTSFGWSRIPLIVSYMNKHIPSSERATILSTINMFHTLLMVIAYPLLGISAEWSLAMTLLILGIVGIGVSLVVRVKEEYLID
jgi:MFS family permease